MSLTPQQSERVSEARIAIRAAPTANDVAGAGYGLYTAREMSQMSAWMKVGAPQDWYYQLYNTGLFMLAMPQSQVQHVLFVPGGGDPTGETYSVAHLQGGQGSKKTLPKVNYLASDAQATASMPLAAASAQSISDWVISQI